MPVIRAAEAQVHEMHNARFTSYIRPETGSTELCVWQTGIDPGTVGVGHKILREEAFVVIRGAVTLHIDGEASALEPGDAAIAPAGSTISLDNTGSEPAALVVTVPVGFAAELADGTRLTPPWAS
ncbi:cupin domain-containing protein [Nocardia sp. NBC_01009]|uniref:cupin domain-containing protein n=1 Tax=Nocardia sp. NBC_01009 TaxID=2975996 RepID=UPI00386981ED|nr:cupin domain-containing protein [Nocardia sp. NBC_01009]